MTKNPPQLNELAFTLTHLRAGECGQIAAVEAADHKSLLDDLGFTPGTPIQVLRKAPFGGPLHVRIRQAEYAIRQADASCLKILKS